MARISFRQGIVRDFQGGSTFLSFNGNFVQLNATTSEPVQVTFAHGPKDYLHTERVTVPEAWGPFTAGNHWLYWEINRSDGTRSFGSTDKEPIEQSQAPSSPAAGQMWFDTTTNEWKEWSGSSWVVKVRVFAAKLSNASMFDSMSINAGQGDFKGTQVGLTSPTRAGALVFDSGTPIFDRQGRFLTTEDEIATGLSSSRIRIDNIVKTATAGTALSPYQIVKLDGPNSVSPANAADLGAKVLGITDEGVDAGDIVDFVTEGIIFNSDWNWFGESLGVNDGVYLNNQGNITATPVSVDQLPIGVVMDAQTIMFAPRLFPQVENEGIIGLTALEQGGAVDTQGLSWDNSAGQWAPANTLKTVGGPVIGDADNATSLRMRGNRHADEGGGKVQSYMGIFHNDGYDSIGTLKTRAIYGADTEMDLSVQSPHQLQIVASDFNETDGQIWMTSKTNIVINAREEAEGAASNQLIIDRVNTSTTGATNTSDVEISVSSGTLQVASDVDFNNTVTIQGDLIVTGTTTTINTQDLTVSDHEIILNSDATAPENARIKVERGSGNDDASLFWDDSADVWKAGFDGGETEIALVGMHTHAASDIVSGTFADARIAQSNVTQHENALTITESQINDLQNYVLPTDSISILADVDTTTTAPSADDVLKWDGSNWTPSGDPGTDWGEIGGTLSNQTDLQTTLDGKSDTGHTHDATDVDSGQFADARISESSVIQHETALTIAESQISDLQNYLLDITNEPLGDLSNVAINSVADNDVLAYDSSSGEWINQTASEAGLAVSGHTHAASDIDSGTFADARIAQSNVTQYESALTITESQISDLGSYLTDITNESLNDLSDVNASTPSENQALIYDGTEWTAQNPENWTGPITSATTLTGTGSNVIVDTSDNAVTVTLPSSPSNGWSFKFVDLTSSWGTNNLTIDADSTDTNTIEGSTTSTQSTSDAMIEVIFLNGDWKVRTIA